MSTARYGRGENITGNIREKYFTGKIVYGASLPYWVGMQGLTTREVGLGAIDTEGDGRLRTQRVSEACLVPVRKGRGLEGEKKETEVGVKIARPLVPIRALTDHRLWVKS